MIYFNAYIHSRNTNDITPLACRGIDSLYVFKSTVKDQNIFISATLYVRAFNSDSKMVSRPHNNL